jgi:hypothetical protein
MPWSAKTELGTRDLKGKLGKELHSSLFRRPWSILLKMMAYVYEYQDGKLFVSEDLYYWHCT